MRWGGGGGQNRFLSNIERWRRGGGGEGDSQINSDIDASVNTNKCIGFNDVSIYGQ